ncbi:disintegrin and metalloproteinase domain-containing protein 5-like [Orycteropus afer afer]|uniref:Disintegrin and metalloproteinase domain-containing protein 5-like n=1 Tax=Orycteropus afer afer TaxID=1230840 RepID=A0A8B6ZC65_ORYAF|nr:disintegrin and metalloproteinase domain-containing protein 5-like [Orycteropus afer afer]
MECVPRLTAFSCTFCFLLAERHGLSSHPSLETKESSLAHLPSQNVLSSSSSAAGPAYTSLVSSRALRELRLYSCLNVSTAVIRAGLQASGAMFLLLVFLTGLGQVHAGLNSHKTFLQTTVPEKISSSDNKKDAENNVAYIITIEGKHYLVHLTKQSFLSSGSVVSSYDENDTLHSKPLIVQMDCNYQGYVAGFPNSLVTLNTCSGLRGILQFENISYGIEPMEAISGFVHLIYEEKNENINIPLLGNNDIYAWSNNSQNQVRKSSRRIESSKITPQYLEMHILVDKNLFDYMGSDINVVTQKVILIIGLVNAMLIQLKLTVIISSIEIWSNKNKISTTGQPDHVLLRLLEWESKYLVLQPHHITFLFVFRKYPSFIGTTFPGKLCNKNYAKGVALYSEGLSLESFAVIIVQLLGLNLGLTYDNNIDSCQCSVDVCTMTPKAVHFGGVKDFSICSLDDFKYIVSQSGLQCLQNHHTDMPVYKAPGRVCGNGVLETGEQCDCGTIATCTHKRCCDPRTCSLKKGMICGSGSCCTQDCKIKPAGTLCRESIDKECDFVEYCNGINGLCVPDTYARNGQSCDSGDGFCYNAVCRSFNKQCQSLIGGASTGGPFDCFEDINSRSDRYGNCGDRHCTFSNLLCGKLVCSWPHKRLIVRANLSVIYTHIRNETCVSTFRAIEKPPRTGRVSVTTYFDADDRDETFVEDGTPCGPDMFCIRFSCKETRFFMDSKACNSIVHCNKSGTCNNFNHCHCHKGFVPPNCTIMKGEFGSVDDGHKFKTVIFRDQAGWMRVATTGRCPLVPEGSPKTIWEQRKILLLRSLQDSYQMLDRAAILAPKDTRNPYLKNVLARYTYLSILITGKNSGSYQFMEEYLTVLTELGTSFMQGRYATSQKQQLQLIAYICLPVLIIVTAILISQNKLRELCYREETESESLPSVYRQLEKTK